MTPEQIKAIQDMLAPVFGCKPEEIEVGEGYATLKRDQPRVNHVWEVTAIPSK